MANFDREFNRLIFNEGGYVNDPNDTGGETYLGISRKHNPKWGGWSVIDLAKKKCKDTKTLNATLKANDNLTKKAKLYYWANYWNVISLDEVPNQKIAHQLFDTCVNCGVRTAISVAQRVIGMTDTGKWSNELYHNLINYK